MKALLCSEELTEHEAGLRAGGHAFWLHLAAIRAGKLHRPMTWAEYLQKRLPELDCPTVKLREANYRIATALAREELAHTDGGRIFAQIRDSHLRELLRLPAQHRAMAIQALQATGPVTANRIKELTETVDGFSDEELRQELERSERQAHATREDRIEAGRKDAAKVRLERVLACLEKLEKLLTDWEALLLLHQIRAIVIFRL